MLSIDAIFQSILSLKHPTRKTLQFMQGKRMDTELFPFFLPRLTFIIAEACLLAGLVQSAYHTGYRTVIFEDPPDCETVRRGTFGAGAAFALVTCVLTGTYYRCFSKARVSYQRPEAAIDMSRYS